MCREVLRVLVRGVRDPTRRRTRCAQVRLDARPRRARGRRGGLSNATVVGLRLRRVIGLGGEQCGCRRSLARAVAAAASEALP